MGLSSSSIACDRDVVVLLPVQSVGGLFSERGVLCLEWVSWLWRGGVGVDVFAVVVLLLLIHARACASGYSDSCVVEMLELISWRR